jgi:lipoyl(octanoyl) transferase
VNSIINKYTEFQDLGLIDYKQAWDYQTSLFNEILETKSRNRSVPEKENQLTPNYLLFCEHPPVYTLGKSGKEENLLIKKEDLPSIHASYYHINRGGDITYHGPGQLVVYPVMDLENFFTDIHRYMRLLEEAVIRTCDEFQIQAGRIDGLTGVWIDFENTTTARKICALGVKTSRWVTMHGLAFNINTDLSYFNHIVPCGIEDKAVTSLAHELGYTVDMNLIKQKIKLHLSRLFEMQLVEKVDQEKK